MPRSLASWSPVPVKVSNFKKTMLYYPNFIISAVCCIGLAALAFATIAR